MGVARLAWRGSARLGRAGPIRAERHGGRDGGLQRTTGADDYDAPESETNTINGGLGDDTLSGGQIADSINGEDGNDTVYALDGADTVNGGVGNDVLYGGAGDDRLTGGGGGDNLNGEDGDDAISSVDGGYLDGGAGDDFITLGAGFETVTGGLGEDLISYAAAPTGVSVNLRTRVGSGGWAEGDSYLFIEAVEGSAFADTLTGSGRYEVLLGGSGDDRLDGGAGGDLLAGFAGFDTLDYSRSSAAVTVDLSTLETSGGHAEGDDLLDIFEQVLGSAFADRLTGAALADDLRGQDGVDALVGGLGNDTLSGGAGADTLTGGRGRDEFTGGAAADRFVLTSTLDSGTRVSRRDVVTDFSAAGGDRLDLSQIDANTAAAGNQAFAFIGAAAFSGVNGELRVSVSGGDAVVTGDVNGDTIADFALKLEGVTASTASDFVL